jgi:hypothetical protein
MVVVLFHLRPPEDCVSTPKRMGAFETYVRFVILIDAFVGEFNRHMPTQEKLFVTGGVKKFHTIMNETRKIFLMLITTLSMTI